jgi:hypothetical protein
MRPRDHLLHGRRSLGIISKGNRPQYVASLESAAASNATRAHSLKHGRTAIEEPLRPRDDPATLVRY